MLGDRDGRAVLIDDLDLGARAALVQVELGDRVGHRHRVADEHRLDEADPVVAERDRGLVDALAFDLGDHQARGRRHEADQQRAVGDAPPVGRAFHVFLVDVVAGEIPGDAGEKIDVGLAHGLRKAHPVADLDMKLGHRLPRSLSTVQDGAKITLPSIKASVSPGE